MITTVGFAVVYRWRIKPDMERQFQEVWSRNTPKIIERCGGMGSRLHKAEDGTWLAYAQWPDRATWERSCFLPDLDPEGKEVMQEAIIESLPRILLEPVRDFLVSADITAADDADSLAGTIARRTPEE